MWLENVRKALSMKRQGMNTFAICSQLRVWPRENQEPFMKTVTTMGDRGARRALKLLARVDQQSKSGVGEAATNIERFILELANAG
jgi:DNA polymerase III delta subunit